MKKPVPSSNFLAAVLCLGDLPDRGEAPLLALRGDGDGIPRALALVLLPEPALAVDQVDLLNVEFEPVLANGNKQVVGLGGASDETSMGDLLDAVALGAGDGMHFSAKVEVDAMLDHGFPKIESRPCTVNMPDEL